jgi:hypothetical protein
MRIVGVFGAQVCFASGTAAGHFGLGQVPSADTSDRPAKSWRRFDANQTEINAYTITHTWNGAGELTHKGMPSYAGIPTDGRSATSLDYLHDAIGNIRSILRNGSPLLDATFRGAGRPLTRNITLPNGTTIG